MPTYDYQCRSCGDVTEVIHAMSEDGPTVCELCGGELRRVLYPAGIIFKGSGFYRTDSRASGGTGSSAPGGSSGANPASSPSSGDGTSTTGTSSPTESSGKSTPPGSGSESAA